MRSSTIPGWKNLKISYDTKIYFFLFFQGEFDDRFGTDEELDSYIDDILKQQPEENGHLKIGLVS